MFSIKQLNDLEKEFSDRKSRYPENLIIPLIKDILELNSRIKMLQGTKSVKLIEDEV